MKAAVSLLSQLTVARLLTRFPDRLVWGAFVFINGLISIALLSIVAMISKTPFVFPSLGATAFLLFMSPGAPASTPRNTLYGHGIGIACGYLALLVTGLANAAPASAVGIDNARIVAIALSLALTGGLMVLTRSAHPPAAATTMIVSLGIIAQPQHLVVIEGAVALLVLQAVVINRVAGIAYPLWAAEAPVKTPAREDHDHRPARHPARQHYESVGSRSVVHLHRSNPSE